jgi:hypothetical protein
MPASITAGSVVVSVVRRVNTATAYAAPSGKVTTPASLRTMPSSPPPLAATVRERHGRVGGPERERLVETGCDGIERPVQLETDVVAPAVVARVGDDAERSVVEGEQNRRGVDISQVAKERLAAIAADGIYLDDVAPGHPAHGVEVVDRAVSEDATGGSEVGRRRRRRIQRRRSDGREPAEHSGVEIVLRSAEGWIEAAGETDLDRHAGVLGQRHEAGGGGRVGGDRLLAERRHASSKRGFEQLQVARRGRGDDHAVDTARQHLGRCRYHGDPDAGPEPSRRGGAHRRLRVGEDELVDAVEPGQRLSVERADPAESDQSQSHRGPPISRTLLAQTTCDDLGLAALGRR